MPRPRSCRQVSEMPNWTRFKPAGVPARSLEQVTMTIDEFEAVRLSDLEGLYQEGAAERMGVSRATFARVLTAARKVVAEALVHGKAVEVSGGTVDRRTKGRWPCPVHGGGRRRGRGCRCRGSSQ